MQNRTARPENNENRILTVPNILSMIRLLMVGGVAVCFFRSKPYVALALYILAMATDLVDGYIARRYNQITKLGKLLDPMADKLMFVAALCGLYVMGYLPGYIIFIVAVKEALMVIGGIFILFVWKDVVYSNLLGKIASVSYTAGILCCFLHSHIAPWDTWILLAAVALNIAALATYAYQNIYKRHLMKRKEDRV